MVQLQSSLLRYGAMAASVQLGSLVIALAKICLVEKYY